MTEPTHLLTVTVPVAVADAGAAELAATLTVIVDRALRPDFLAGHVHTEAVRLLGTVDS